MTEHLARKVGKVIRQLRSESGLSQEAFANLCGLHRTYIGCIECGEKTITVVTASKLAAALGISLAQLFAKVEAEAGLETAP